MKYKGYIITESKKHGKVVKGAKRSNSIQVRKPLSDTEYLLEKQISYPIGDDNKKQDAIEKAKKYVDEKPQ